MRSIHVFIVAFAFFVLPAAAQNAPADLYITGGAIYTGDADTPEAEAVAIKDGIIVYVGPATASSSFIGPETEILDLQNMAAFPGFTDSHVHLRGIGKKARSLSLSGAKSLAALQKNLRDWHRSHPDEQVLLGNGWIETHWPEKRFPSRWDLDSIVADIPVILFRADNHALVANSKALELAGVSATTQIPEGGDIHRNVLGEATGMFIDNAQQLITRLIPNDSEEEILADMVAGARIMTSLGWTGVHTMSVGAADIPRYNTLSDSGDIRLRLYHSVIIDDADDVLTAGLQTSQSGRSITRAIKVALDGALGSRGAALLEPYSDAATSGLLLTDKETLMPILTEALKKGIQINAHAIGDKANRLALDWFEEAFAKVPVEERLVASPRWRIEHAQIISESDLPRFAALGVIASMQPSHAIGDLHFAPSRLDQDRLAEAYKWSSLLASGATVTGGSDAPVEEGNPLIEFYAATARRDLSGFQGEGWHAEEAVTRSEALTMFTLAPAIASFQENQQGSLTVGKQADLSIFNLDLMTAEESGIPKAQAAYTIIAGEIVYKAPFLASENTPDETVHN